MSPDTVSAYDYKNPRFLSILKRDWTLCEKKEMKEAITDRSNLMWLRFSLKHKSWIGSLHEIKYLYLKYRRIYLFTVQNYKQ